MTEIVRNDLIGWHFPEEPSEQWDGFNDSGIEHFLGDPFGHLGREIIQNAIDASLNGSVAVKFNFIRVETNSVPYIDELKDSIFQASKSAEGEGRKAKVFFDNAKSLIENETINLLQISDYNTEGMKGPTLGTPFYAFMKASGQSKKSSETASGSFGIGKYAPYAVSNFRTIFVSTVFENEDRQFNQLTQGKSLLISHTKEGKLRRGIGFFGIKEKCRPIQDVDESLPGWVQRVHSMTEIASKKGTTLSILSFNDVVNWQELLAASVAENFFGAISVGKLSVDINETYHLDQENIHNFFADENIKNKITENNNEPENFDNCMNYLKTISGDENEVYFKESEMTHLGRCRVKVMVGDNLPKKVCILRNGMFITDNLNRLKKFNDYKDFVAVFECLSQKGNKLLREMEPPRHDGFEPDRLPLKNEQKIGRKALKDLAFWVRDILKQYARNEPSEVTSIDELKEFFGEEGDSVEGNGMEEINPFGKVVLRAKPVKISFKNKINSPENEPGDDDNENGELGEDENGSGGSGRGGDRPGNGQGGPGGANGGQGGGRGGRNSNTKPVVKLNNVRAVLKDPKTRRLSYTPSFTGEIALKIFAVGADTDYNLQIVQSEFGAVDNGKVILYAEDGKRCSHDVTLNQNFTGSLKVVANEI